MRPLVNQLVKGMLTIGTWLTPDDWTRSVVYFFTISTYIFPIALHIALLEIGSKTVEVLIIGENGFRICPQEISVPNPH